MEEAIPQPISREVYGGLTAARARVEHQFGGVFQPDRSSQYRYVYYVPDRQLYASIEQEAGRHIVILWTACPCALDG